MVIRGATDANFTAIVIVPPTSAATASQPAARVRVYTYATKIIHAASPSSSTPIPICRATSPARRPYESRISRPVGVLGQ